jgi:putative GTP pyrophosphokinase
LTAHDQRFMRRLPHGKGVPFDALRQWTTSGAIEAALQAMAKGKNLPHWGTKGRVNRAGGALRQGSLTDDQAMVLESWRIAHTGVIHTFEAMLRARAKDKNVQVAQRLKRRTTIIDKLSRFPRMELARMDDIAGCRLIFPDIKSLHTFRDKVHQARFKHVLKNQKNKYDYLQTPTERGYRGIHDVYEYRARKKKSTKYDGLLIEIQYRTNVQHAWATAVEVVTQLTENEPKFNRGDPRHIKLFCLASEMLARAHEGTSSILKDIGNSELVQEFDKLDGDIRVIRMLTDLVINEWIGDRMESDHVILHIRKEDTKLELHQFDLELEASTKLLELEKEFPNDDIVLVGARNVGEVISAFRNYFNDVREFMNLIFAARKILAPQSKPLMV